MSLVYWLYLATPLTPRGLLERVAQQPSASPVQQDTSHPDLVGYWVSSAGVVVSTHEWVNAAAAEEVDDLEPSIEATFRFAPTCVLLFNVNQELVHGGTYQGVLDVIATVVVLAHATHGGMLLREDFRNVLLWQADCLVLDHAAAVWQPVHLQLLPEPYTFEKLYAF